MELLNKLGIDWRLLIAQIINFSVLLFVLYKVAYKPILQMLDKRAKTIEKGLRDAKASEELLAKIEKLKEEKITAAEKEVGKLIEEARKDAETMKKDILAAASSQAEDLLKRARLQMAEEKEKMVLDIKKEVTAIIVTATGKILQREFSGDDQKRLLEAISKEMKSA